jgi:tetratricopeptide (TPR) repeat protein
MTTSELTTGSRRDPVADPAATAEEWRHGATSKPTYRLAAEDFKQAEAQLQRSITTLELQDRTDLRQLGHELHTLATLLAAVGRRDDAIETYERALAIKRAQIDPDAADLALTLHDLAVVYAAVGRDDDAQSLWSEASVALRAR